MTRDQSGAPATASESRVFPGWWMIAIAAAAQYMSGPGQSYSVAAFKNPMQATLNISDTRFSLAYGFATLLSGLSLPFVGRLVDRHGARRVLPVVAIVLGTACLGMSRVTTLPGVYLGFSLIRCSGQGALVLLSMWIVGEWFSKRKGVAASIVGLGGSLSVMTFPLINHMIIFNYGWHTAWVVFAVAVWLLIIPPSLLILRDRPEDLGLQPDGLASAEKIAPDSTRRSARKHSVHDQRNEFAPSGHIWTVGEVLRDPTFWKLVSAPASCGMIITALTFHQVSILGSRGVEPGWALGLISLQALVATLFAFPAGWLTDRVAGRHLLAVAMMLLSMASALVLFMPVPQLAPLYAALLGLNGALLRTAGNVIWLNYYGRGNQGGIRGVVMSAMILGAAIGPLPAAFAIDFFGSYNPALVAFAAISAAVAWLVSTARPTL
jgi:MFS family permease